MSDPGVCQSISHFVCLCHAGAKTTERIDVLFGVETPGDPGSILLVGGFHPHRGMLPLPNYFGHLLFHPILEGRKR